MRFRIPVACITLTVLACAAQRQHLAADADPDADAGSGDATASVRSLLVDAMSVSPYASLDPRVPLAVRGRADPPLAENVTTVSISFEMGEDGTPRIKTEEDADGDSARTSPESQHFIARAGADHWTLTPLELWADPVRCTAEEGRFVCGDSVVTVEEMSPPLPMHEEAWALWSDVAERVRVDKPLFLACCEDVLEETEERQALQEATALEAEGRTAELADFVRGLPHLQIGDWKAMRQRATQAENHELAIALFEHAGLTMGRCSHDGSPVLETQQYADSCLALGRTNCFLNLMVRVLGNQAERFIYSSLAHNLFESQSAHLEKADLDLARFLLGLLIRYDVSPPRQAEVDEQSLAKAIVASELEDELIPELTRLVESEALDEANRLRATVTLYFLRAPPPYRPRGGVTEAEMIENHQVQKAHLEQTLEAARELAGLRHGMLGSWFLGRVILTTQSELEGLPGRLAQSLEWHREFERRMEREDAKRLQEQQERESRNTRRRRSAVQEPVVDPNSRDPFCDGIRKSGVAGQLSGKIAEEVRKRCGRLK